MDMVKFRAMYLAEAGEHLQEMAAVLMQLAADLTDRQAIDSLFRNAHSIKGMAGTMEFAVSAHLAHHLEDRLDLCRERGQMTQQDIDWVLDGVGLLEGLLEDIRQGKAERSVDGFINQGGQPAEVSSDNEIDSAPVLEIPESRDPLLVRLVLKDMVAVPGARLLVLLKKCADLGTVLESNPSQEALLTEDAAPEQLLVQLDTELSKDEVHQQLEIFSELQEISFPAKQKAEPPQPRQKPIQTKTVRVSTELLDHFINLTGELITTRYHLQNAVKERHWHNVDDGVGQLTRLVKNLHRQVLQVRMVSLENLFSRLSRTVHELARVKQKQVRLVLEGAEIELDRAIVEGLTDALGHMVRNAIDHGIRDQGTIHIKAWRERDQVLLQVADDGAGMDPETIRERAVARGLVKAALARTLKPYDVLQLVCLPGFSTADNISATSGRGVGMDVVKTAVEKVGGLLEIDSEPGNGTRITLKLPLSLAIIRVLIVSCHEVPMALPINRIVQTLEISRQEVQSSGKQLVIEHQGKLLPLLSLRKILRYPKAAQTDPIAVVVTELFGRRVGLVVDRLAGQREVFVQRLPAPFDQIRGCNGATILGDGQIVFLLDLQSLLERRRT